LLVRTDDDMRLVYIGGFQGCVRKLRGAVPRPLKSQPLDKFFKIDFAFIG
jgi:hypothetical protein